MKWLAFGCIHAPITHEGYWDWLLKQVNDFQPDIIVNLGDWFEGKAAKRWPEHPSETWDLAHEFKQVARQAAEINEIAPNSARYWLFGNHCDNVFNEPHRLHKDVQPLVRDWQAINPYGIADALKDWKVTAKYGHDIKLRLGPLTFQHGCQTGKGIPQSHLKDQAYAYARPFGLHVSAHTHEPVPVTQCRERSCWLPYWYANVGTGADWDRMHYMDRLSKQAWGRGCVLGEVNPDTIKHRRAAFSSREWDAETRVHSYFAESRCTKKMTMS